MTAISWFKWTVALLAVGLATGAGAVTFTPLNVAPGVYAFIGDTGGRTYKNEGMNANTGFIVTTDGVVVVDSGSTYLAAKAMHKAIQRVTGQPVKYVVNTGGQDHRWLGNGYFAQQGAEIIAARAALADMQERGAAQVEAMKTVLRKKLQGTKPVFPTRLFDQKEILKLGATELHIVRFHGAHTPGDAVVWLPQSGVLFSGDMVYVDRLLGVIPVSSSRDWLASFEEMEKLNPKVIVPGHGRVCDLAKARAQTRDYLVLLRNHMRQALDGGLDLQTAIDALDQGAYRHLANWELLKGGNASRVYLEMEAE
jgi:glyoxylase-like metal-dependent hydrolase (beta-lactamase superfamily II)